MRAAEPLEPDAVLEDADFEFLHHDGGQIEAGSGHRTTPGIDATVGLASADLAHLEDNVGVEQEHQEKSAGRARSRERGNSISISSIPGGRPSSSMILA